MDVLKFNPIIIVYKKRFQGKDGQPITFPSNLYGSIEIKVIYFIATYAPQIIFLNATNYLKSLFLVL